METEKIVYLNKPLSNDEQDWIGIKPYIDSLSSAIYQGANMIAVTSKFGGGKSSISESLERNMDNQKDSEGYDYKFLKVNLWNHLEGDCRSIQIHKNFIYQLAIQLDKYDYVSKRLSKNFGFLKLELKDERSNIIFVIMIISFLIAFFASKFSEFMPNEDIITIIILLITMISNMITIVCVFLLITKSGIIFSSSKSENNIELEENDIVDFYRQILQQQKNKHHIIIFEDIDRSNKKEIIASFLKGAVTTRQKV